MIWNFTIQFHPLQVQEQRRSAELKFGVLWPIIKFLPPRILKICCPWIHSSDYLWLNIVLNIFLFLHLMSHVDNITLYICHSTCWWLRTCCNNSASFQMSRSKSPSILEPPGPSKVHVFGGRWSRRWDLIIAMSDNSNSAAPHSHSIFSQDAPRWSVAWLQLMLDVTQHNHKQERNQVGMMIPVIINWNDTEYVA